MSSVAAPTESQRRWWLRDSGQALGPELIVLVVMALVVWGALSWLGRLTQTGQSIENAAQSAARIASQQPDPDTASAAARQAIADSRIEACATTPSVEIAWTPGPTGTWRGGTVTATVTCAIANTEPLTSNGRTVTGTDTQVIDPFRTSNP